MTLILATCVGVAGGVIGGAGGAYSALYAGMAENRRAIGDLERLVARMDQERDNWEKTEVGYDVEVRARLDRLAVMCGANK